MDLHEYQAKQRFAAFGIPIIRGFIARTPEDAYQIAQRFNSRVVLKAQILAGERGKAGGIRIADSPDEARAYAAELLGTVIKGHLVHKLLINPYVKIERKLYLAIANDRSAQRPVILASDAGGTQIEEVYQEMPEKILRTYIEPLLGLRHYQIVDIASAMDIPQELWSALTEVIEGLYRCFTESDATVCEINPLAIIEENHQRLFRAIDAKMSIDDNALYRHADILTLLDNNHETQIEAQARASNLSYIKLQGQIGCVVNSAGLAMAAIDTITRIGAPYGITPANFLDIGGGATAYQVAAALPLVLMDKQVKTVLINIFGGMTRCDEVAKGIVMTLENTPTDLLIVVRLVGTYQDEGRQILRQAALPHIINAETMYEAVQTAIGIVREVTVS